jgi:hypothetical protein
MDKTRTAFGLILLLPLLIGCGNPGVAPTAEVTGTVTYKGAPLENVNVVFTPANGRPATGTTDAEGKFSLSTFAADDGAVPGEHTVTIAEGPTDTPPPMPGMPGYGETKSRFPARYSDPAKSGLTATVKEGEANQFKFELTD